MKKRQAGIIMLALMLAFSMTAGAFAVSGTADSDSTDYITNRTGNSTAVRQENSSSTGTIRLGKILTVSQQGRFPDIEDFVFRITPVAAWDNANTSTSGSGAMIPPAAMPRPESSETDHHSVISADSAFRGPEPWTALAAVGDFSNGSEDNTSGIYGDRRHEYINSDAASNTDLIGEDMRRTRVTDVSFNFTKAGYYMYMIEEAGSSPNGSVSNPYALKKDVAGVDYDDNTYYAVFYVCNREEAGDTADGVYVHTITSWTNSSDTDYRPDNSMRVSDELADTQNWLHDLMLSGDVDGNYSTDYGDGGHSAAQNTGRAGGSGSSAIHDNLGKVGMSTPEDPDFLEAFRMWNGQDTHDVVIRKNVTGNLGDRTKEFVFEVTLTGLAPDQIYTTDKTADQTGYATSAAVKMYDMTPASCLAEDGKSFTADSTGTVSFKVKLRDDDILVLNSLPGAASYQVKEQASDHVAQYNIVSTNKGEGTSLPVFTETGHTAGGTDAAHLGRANTDMNAELSTMTEFADRYDETVIITFSNNRDLATLTGVAGLDYMVYAAAVGVLSVFVFIIVRKRREYAEEDFDLL